MPKVRIPTPLRSLSGGAAEVEVDGSTVTEVLKALEDAPRSREAHELLLKLVDPPRPEKGK